VITLDSPISHTKESASLTYGEDGYAISDAGCYRDLNEDRCRTIITQWGRAWIVCDGMGGAEGGEFAAQLAVDTIVQSLSTPRKEVTALQALIDGINEANRTIVLRRQGQGFRTMGTTVVAILYSEKEFFVGHAGDSRAYRVSGKSCAPLTVDHTYVQDLVDQGTLEPELSLRHPQAHVLTRCLGASAQVDLDTGIFRIDPNGFAESIVLATDGLYSLVEDHEIASHVRFSSPSEACRNLVELARSRGGYDNITVAVIPLQGALERESLASLQKEKYASSANSVRSRFSVRAHLLTILFVSATWVTMSLVAIAVAGFSILYFTKI
jgi:PPM family protein phosphatase